MTAQVGVGVDGSPESLAAAAWAAREAVLREVPLRVVCVEESPTSPEIPLSFERPLPRRARALLRDAAERARAEHRGLPVTAEEREGRAADELTEVANESDLMVLGSRGLGGALGFLTGSVSLGVVGRAVRPVVLVRGRAGQERDASARDSGEVTVGVDVHDPCAPLLEFAFAEAARRGGTLRVLHAWTLPAPWEASLTDRDTGEEPGVPVAAGLTDLLEPWQERYRDVRVASRAVAGSPASQLVDASRDAQLVIVGRRHRKVMFGPHLGRVAHAVIHHSPAPVAVVPLG
ncbi:universal stress protein [Streptomyces argenteolus]|uniref:universal stress protein n=1 Tax=Streptomyces sp. NPDC025273 TaxID=3155251 RepID=UPI0033F13A63